MAGTFRYFPRLSRLPLPGVLFALVALLLVGCQGSAGGTVRASAAPTYALTYAVVGASDAWGVGTDDPDRLGWPTVLAGDLSPNTHLINLGIPQATVAVAQTLEVPIATSAKPSIITVWLALNDYQQHVSLGTYRQQLYDLLAGLRAGTSAKIYVGNMPDLSRLPFFNQIDPMQLQKDVAAWNDVIAADCAATGATLVDIHAAFAAVGDAGSLLSADGLHPSNLGARLLAQTFLAAIHTGT